MLNANAQLFSMFTLKKRSARSARRGRGMLGRAMRRVLEASLAEEEEGRWSWEGRAKSDVRANWTTVIIRPG